jgi:hypothetical protein
LQQAFYAVGDGEMAPFLLKKEAEAYAATLNGKAPHFSVVKIFKKYSSLASVASSIAER